jgi:hypothetical protein
MRECPLLSRFERLSRLSRKMHGIHDERGGAKRLVRIEQPGGGKEG